MTTGEMFVLLLFAAGLVCSLTLFIWLVRMIKKERGQRRP